MAKVHVEPIQLSKLVYSVAETASLLSVSRQTVYHYIQRGEIVPINPTSKTQVSAQAIIRFVEQQQRKADQEAASQRWRQS
jgi:excisionase family DNA binding protein